LRPSRDSRRRDINARKISLERCWRHCLLFFLLLELSFFKTLTKIHRRRMVPLVLGAAIFLMLMTLEKGITLGELSARKRLPSAGFTYSMLKEVPLRVSGTAVYLSSDPTRWFQARAFPSQALSRAPCIIFAALKPRKYPGDSRRLAVTNTGGGGLWSVCILAFAKYFVFLPPH
jgi:hypothetical protein